MFRYRATDPQGRVIDGVVDALNERAALDELRRKQLWPVFVSPVAKQARRTAPKAAEGLALYARSLADVFGAGVPLDRALVFAAEQSNSESVTRAGRAVQQAVAQGASLADAMGAQPEFGAIFSAMVSAGEESGALEESLQQVADHLDEMTELRSQVKSALLYPALVGAVSIAAVALLMLFVIPRFGAMLQDEGGQLPFSTRALMAVSGLALKLWWLLPVIAVVLVRMRPRLPLLTRIDDEYSVVVYARTLGMLLRSGRAVLPAMQTAAGTVTATPLRAKLVAATEAVASGSTIRAALGAALPPLAVEMLAAGEETGRLDEMCLRVANAFETNVRRSLRSAVALLEPILILFMAGVVGFVALAMLQAIYSINRSMF